MRTRLGAMGLDALKMHPCLSPVLLLLTLATPACASRFPLTCSYLSNDATGELGSHPNCAAHSEVQLGINSDHLDAVKLDQAGLGQVLVEGQWFYIRPDGRSLSVITFDNGADYFSEGLVRSRMNGKIAYCDAALTQVIAPKYDWGWPFEQGRAMVCIGCKPGVAGEDGHVPVEGGVWGYIDRVGNEVVPVTPGAAEAVQR